MKFTIEKYLQLRTDLDKIYDHFNTNNPEQIGVEFRGVTAEAIIFTHADREIVELNAVMRAQFDRIEQEHLTMCKLINLFTATLGDKIESETEEVKS